MMQPFGLPELVRMVPCVGADVDPQPTSASRPAGALVHPPA
jgi:hypothetical protein